MEMYNEERNSFIDKFRKQQGLEPLTAPKTKNADGK